MKTLLSILLYFIIFVSGSTLAGAAESSTKATQEETITALFKANEAQFVFGPATVNLGAQGSMSLKRGQAFIPQEVAQKIFEALGTKAVRDLYGVVIPGLPGDEVPTDEWGFVIIFFRPLGFVRDDDAKSWDHAKMLDAQRSGIEERNKEARQQGRPERELTGWIEAPHYDASSHRLLWATSTQDKGKPETALALYSAAALGREGILFFAFGTEAKKLPERQGLAGEMLASIQFKEGKRYENYAEGTDRVAEIGLAALIGGVAAKKLGLFATLAILLAKWGKVIAFAIGGLAIFKWRKKKTDAAGGQ